MNIKSDTEIIETSNQNKKM